MSTPTPALTVVPPEQVGLPPTAAQPVVAEVQVQQETVSAAAAATLAALVVIWASIDVGNPFGWWFRGGSGSPAERAFVAVSMGQETAAMATREYVLRSLAHQGYALAAPSIDPIRYAGHASDGGELEAKLEHAVWTTYRATRAGRTPAEAKAAGLLTLSLVADTEVDDAAREVTAALIASAEVVDLSPRATENTEEGRDAREREVTAQLDQDRDVARVLADLDRILADAQANEAIRRRAEEEESRAERRARLARDEAQRLLERAEDDVIREAERILAEADAREAVREAERIARFAARREARAAVKKYELGWIRVLTPPSCGRCVVLAGKFYRFNGAFQRHPNCDCLALPVTVASADNYVTDPQLSFESMTPAEQDASFGKANAEAIRAGADIGAVVNAYSQGNVFAVDGRTYTRASTTKRGSYRFSAAGKAGALRATPTTLIQAAKGDRDEARRLLARFGYIRD